jgi:hypothetical protein
MRRDDQLAALADCHARDSFVPSLDDLSAAEHERDRRSALDGRM